MLFESVIHNFLCPYCLHEYNKSKVLYWCQDCRKASRPNFGELEPISCKQGCGGKANIRKCFVLDCPAGPEGTEFIPKQALESRNLPFSIVGVTNSGKSNYITVMLHELEHGGGTTLTAGPLNKSSRQKQAKACTKLYERHQKLEPTDPGTETPQIWQIRNTMLRRGKRVPTYTFTVFDGAGESNQDLDPTSVECRYIAVSKAIMITIDPLILENVRNSGQVDETVLKNSRYDNPDNGYINSVDVVNSVADYIRTARGIRGEKQLTIPVAVILTKLDTILNHSSFAPDAVIRAPSTVLKDGRINTAELSQLDAEIRHWLVSVGEGAFLAAIEANFSNCQLFGVSSYGSAPSENNAPLEIRPHRVLDPLFWLFYQQGFFG